MKRKISIILRFLLFQFTLAFLFEFSSSGAFGQDDLSNRNLNNIIFEENFETGTQWLGVSMQFPEPHSFAVVENPIFRGKYAGKFELRYGDSRATLTGIRTEVSFREPENPERWYSYSVYFPSGDWGYDEDQEIITQWHGVGFPNMCMMVHNGDLRFRIGNDHKAWNWYEFGKVVKDKWIEFKFHVIHSKSGDGLVEVWRNGSKVVTHKGPNMFPDASEIPNWKLGIYKWTWDKGPTLVNKRVLYFDNIKIGNENSKLEDFLNPIGPPKPILASPLDQNPKTILSPFVKWLNRDATSIYRVQVSEDSNFSNLILNIGNIVKTEYQLTGLKENRRYYWRVRASNTFGDGEWSDIWAFNTISSSTENDLIGLWKMEERRGDILYDHSGNGNDGLFINPTNRSPYWIEGKEGLALRLYPVEGNINVVNHNASQDIGKALTISAWVMPRESGNRAIISKGNSDGFILRRNDDGKFYFSIKTNSSGSPLNLTTKQSYANNVWVHVAVTFNGSKAIFYINGKEEINATYEYGLISAIKKPIEIGSTEGSNRWVGNIDELRLYKRALSTLEILDLYEKQPESEMNSVPVPVSGISVSPSTYSLELANSYQLNVTVSPSNASDKTVIWTSSKPEIATVNSSGLVKGVGLGTALITAKTQDGDFTNSSTINVIESDNSLAIESFTLLNGGNNTEIQSLSHGDRLDYGQLKNINLNFRANPNISQVGSVVIALEGPVNSSRTDNGFTFDLLNDSGLILPLGNYKLTATPYSAQNRGGIKGGEYSIEFSIVDNMNEQTLQVESFTLINTYDNKDFFEIYDGMKIDSDLIQDYNLNIRANTNPIKVGSVFMTITGPINHSITENVTPYALFGDRNGNYTGQPFPKGEYTLVAVPYGEANKGGTLGKKLSIKFSIIDAEVITVPDKPILLTPTNKSVDLSNTLNFQWNKVVNAETYRIQLSETSDFSTVVINQDRLESEEIQISDLKSGTQYFWRVRASNGVGNSSWSTIWTFHTKTATKNVYVTGVSLSTTDTTLNIGSQLQLEANVSPSNATNKNISWTSSDSNTASVDDKGFVTALKKGEVIITVKTEEGGYHAIATIYVYDTRENYKIESFYLVDAESNLEKEEIVDGTKLEYEKIKDLLLNFRVNVNPSEVGSVFISLEGPITSSRVDNGYTYDLLNDDGLYLPSGKYTLTAIPYSESNRGGVEGIKKSISFSVEPPQNIPVTGVSINPKNTSLEKGESLQFTATISPSDASNKNVIWHSSDPLVASINEEGLVSAISLGTVTITAHSQEGDIEANASLMVTDPDKKLGIADFTLINADNDSDMYTLSNGAELDINQIQNINLTIRVNSNPPTVGSVEIVLRGPINETRVENGLPYQLFGYDNGDYFGKKFTLGDYILEATPYSGKDMTGDQGTSEIIKFSVVEPIIDNAPNTPILISPVDLSTDLNNSLTFQWKEIEDADSYSIQISEQSDYSSLFLNMEQVTQSQIDVNKFISGTQYFWRVKSSNQIGESEWSETWSFTIKATPIEEIIKATGISVSPAIVSLQIGESIQLNGEIEPSNASNKMVIWLSSDPEIATVSPDGLVTAIGKGNVTISVITQDGNFTDNSTITVTDPNQVLGISGFTLIDATSNTDIFTLSNGAKLDIKQIQDLDLNIRVNTNPPTVGSVLMSLSGPLSESKTENTAPYALFGHNNGNYNGRKFTLGNYILVATPYSDPDQAGVKGNPTTIEFSVIETDTEQVLDTPILISPTNQLTGLGNSLMMKWQETTNATSYFIQISEKSDFSNLFLEKNQISVTQYQVDGLVSGTKYFWRVRASNNTSESSWSEIWSFTTKEKINAPNAPLLLGPENLSIGLTGTITLKWTKTENAEVYRIQIAKDAEYTRKQFDLYNIPSESFDINNLEAGTTFYWRVNASNEEGTSEFSETWKFETLNGPDAPNLISPTDSKSDLDTNVKLEWESVLGADTYRLQVSNSRDFSERIIDQSNIQENLFNLENMEEGRTYFWRVRATNKAGNSIYSEIWNFTTKISLLAPTAPELVSPFQSEILNASNVDFEWKSVNTAEKYHIQVSKYSNFSQQIVLNNNNVTGNKINFEGLEPDQVYFWRVRAINAAGSSPYSAVWLFKTEPLPSLDTPILISPVNGTIVDSTTVEFNWEMVNEAETYHLEVSKDSTFNSGLMQFKDLTQPNFIVDSLERVEKYFWRVQANGKRPSSQSEIWSFEVGEDPSVTKDKASPVRIKAYPNPFDDILQLEFSKVIEGEVTIIISDNKGIPVFEVQANNIQESITLEIPQGWPKGVYVVRVQGFGFMESKKIIKN